MEKKFSDDEIRGQALAFMRDNDIYPIKDKDTYLILDGKIHRYSIQGDKNGETTGAYVIHSDSWPAGYFQDWRNGFKAKWTFNGGNSSYDNYFREHKKEIEDKQRIREEEDKKRKSDASERARILFEQCTEAEDFHPYLLRKGVKTHGIRYQSSTNNLIIPLRDVNGKLLSIQTIDKEGNKRFFFDAPLKGAFFSFDLDKIKDNKNIPVLLGEGFATMAKIHEVTGSPAVAAMTSGSLMEVAKELKKKYHCNIILTADNDLDTQEKTGKNPGLNAANEVLNAGLAVEVIEPPFKVTGVGSDWDDYIMRYGADNPAVDKLISKIKYWSLSKEERKDYDREKNIKSLLCYLNPSTILPEQEFIGGLFPRGFISAVVAPPGTGKTIFMQKSVSDLSIGGTFFDGFVEDEPPRNCLIFAGEAGSGLLLRRGASLKWPINPQRVTVVDQYNFEIANNSVMLDEPEGWKNIKQIVDIAKPDIIFFDTVMSFHSKDENKAAEMKPIFKKLNDLAKEYNVAIVLNHHSRKRTAKERTLSLNQDDVIGSSIFNRLVSLIIGIEPMKEDDKILLVRPLKTWFSAFMPFTYQIKEDDNGRTLFETNLTPEGIKNSKIAVWNYLRATFTPGDWFSLPQILLNEIEGKPAIWQVRRILAEFVKDKKLRRRGATKSLEYSLIGFYDKEE